MAEARWFCISIIPVEELLSPPNQYNSLAINARKYLWGEKSRLRVIRPFMPIYSKWHQLIATLSWHQILWDRILSLTPNLMGYSVGIKRLEMVSCKALLPRQTLGKALAPSQGQPYPYIATAKGKRGISTATSVSGILGCFKRQQCIRSN